MTLTFEQITTVLKGIDKTELDADYGWWETTSEAKFGANKLAEIKALFPSAPVIFGTTTRPTANDLLIAADVNRRVARMLVVELYEHASTFEKMAESLTTAASTAVPSPGAA